MSVIKNVVVIASTGNLGPPIVRALVAANFNVTALTRGSSAPFSSPVQVHKVDYESASSLAEVFKGQDAVVSPIATGGLGIQKKIIDAAVQAGVKRFIPSEFGIDTRNAEGGLGKILSAKQETREYLDKVSKENPGFTWTGISTSLFFDWGFKWGSLGFSLPNKTATIFDSGNEPFHATNLDTIGEAVTSVLSPAHFAATANRYLLISGVTTTQNAILSILEEATGEKFKVSHVSTEDSLKTADEKLAKGDFSAFGDYLKVRLFKDGKGAARTATAELANKELGLREDDVRETVRRVLKV